MKRLLFLLAFVSNLAFGQLRGFFNTVPQRQAAWDAIIALPSIDYWQGPRTTGGQGGFWKETTFVNQCKAGDECYGIKSGGPNKPTPSDLLFAGTTSLTPANAQVPWKDDGNVTGLMPLFFDNGQFDKGLRFRNGPPNVGYYETNPGSFTPITQPIHIIKGIRYWPHTPDETTLRVGTTGSTTATERIRASDGWTPTIVLANGQTYNYYIDNVEEVITRPDNTWQIYINGVSMGTGTGVSFSTNEWIWGTGSHNMQADIRYCLVKFGEFSATDRATILAKSQTIWPWAKPSYPFITDLYWGDNTTWDGTAKSWRAGRGKSTVFTGGTGTAGTHKYVWYWRDKGDATLFPSADGPLTNIRQIPASVNISTMAAGNSVSAIAMDGVNLCAPCATYATSVTVTADAIVTLINSNQTQYSAQRRGSTILFHPQGVGSNVYHTNAVTITGSGFSPTKIDAPRGQDLVRTTYAVANQIFFGHEGDNVMQVECAITPFDSAGNPGPTIFTRVIDDNIP